MLRYLFLALAGLTLAACATGAKPGAMAVPVSETTVIGEASPLRNAVEVAEVTGGKKTNPLWTSEVSNEDFLEALRQSFTAHAMLANEGGKYRLTAELVEVKQPLFGFDMKVTSTVNYRLTDLQSGEPVLEETVTSPYTAKMGDAFVGVKRLRLANEGSIRSNIQQLIEQIVSRFGGAQDTPAETEEEAEEDPQS